jgi:hypothetical protein
LHKLSIAAVVFGAENAARSGVLPMGNHAAVAHGEAAVVTGTHGAHLMTNASLLPLKLRGLAPIELAVVEAMSDASLLVELALADGVILWRRRRGLCKRDGGRCNNCRHKDELHESHGVSPSVAALI